jgi:hypothetical protein
MDTDLVSLIARVLSDLRCAPAQQGGGTAAM